MEFEYSNKWHGISKVNINAGDKWEYLGITNKYLNSVFYKIDDGKKDENGYREVSQKEFSILEKLIKDAAGKKGHYRFFDEDFQEMEKQIDEGKIEGLPIRNTEDEEEKEQPQYKEKTATRYGNYIKQDLEDIKNGEADIETIRQKYIENIKKDLKKYHHYDKKFPEDRYQIDVVFNGKYYESFVYDKEYASLKKTDPQKLEHTLDEFMNGNFAAINTIENPVEFLEAYRKRNGGNTLFSALISAYKDGKISSDKIIEYTRTLENKFYDFEKEYKASNPNSKLENDMSFWYGSYFDLQNRTEIYFEQEKQLLYNYADNKFNREQVKDLQKFIKENYNIELNEYIASKIIDLNDRDYSIYEYDFEEIKNYYKNQSKKVIDLYSDPWYSPEKTYDIDKNKIKEMQEAIKETFGEEIPEFAAAHMIRKYLRKHNCTKSFDLEKFKADCISGKLFADKHSKDFKEYMVKAGAVWEGVVENDSLESLEKAAQATEDEYGRYNFDMTKSPIADLVRQSEKMRDKAENELKVTKTNDKITIKNKSTGEERIIDLNYLTSNLDTKHKNSILGALNGFNKISLWEFAIEAKNKIGTDIHYEEYALAEYNVEKDNININTNPNAKEDVDSYTILHEMMHAMMATIIDGKNTLNENLFKELVDTYREEQAIHKEKRLRSNEVNVSNYTYCAENLTEFAAEAGCLWLSGHSNSEYTIAMHFPKSYRLLVQLIEKIRAQKTGRSSN